MYRPRFVVAMVLMLGLMTLPGRAEQDGIFLDQWDNLDTIAVSPSAMAAAAALAEEPPHAVNREKQAQQLSLSEEDVQQSSEQQLSDESNMLPVGLHAQLSDKRSLLEANAQQLSAAIDAINQVAAATSAAGTTSATAPTAGRRLRAANITVQQDLLAVGGRYNLLASDAWNAMYGLLKAVRAAFTLLSDLQLLPLVVCT